MFCVGGPSECSVTLQNIPPSNLNKMIQGDGKLMGMYNIILKYIFEVQYQMYINIRVQ